MLTVEKDFFTAAESAHVRALDHMIRGLMETRKTVQAQLVGYNGLMFEENRDSQR